MPSSPLDDILASIDPIDAATLFATLKGAVPLGMMFRSGELNRGEQEELERKYAGIPRAAPVPREPTVEEQIAEFERQFPNPVMRRVMVEELLKQRQLQPQPKPALGPRRVYPEPVITQEMRPIRRMKGGSVKKTLDEMQAELAKKGVKDAPDLSRRSFFGLPQSQSFPLAKLPTKELEKLKDAPSVEQSMTRITPSANAPKIEQTVKRVAETPVSRRTVLKSATGQVLKGVLPDMGGLGALGKQAMQAAESVVPAVTADMIPGLIMTAIKKGMSEEDAVKFVRDQLGDVPPTKAFDPSDKEFQLQVLYRNLSDPMDAPNDWEFFGPILPSGALNVMLHTPGADVPPMQLRGALRQIREADPERYRQLIDAAKDFSMGSFETTLESGMMTPRNLEKYKKGEHAQPVYRPEHLWNND